MSARSNLDSDAEVSGSAPRERFDYQQVNSSTARTAMAVSRRYRRLRNGHATDIGRDLLAVKKQMNHGQFAKWVETEMSISLRSARLLMKVATHFGNKSELVSQLPRTALYKLASNTTPTAIREEILKRLEAGEEVTPKEIAIRLSEAREKADEDALLAVLTPMSKRRHELQSERKRQKQKEYQLKNEVRVVNLAKILFEALENKAFDSVEQLARQCNLFELHDALIKVRNNGKY